MKKIKILGYEIEKKSLIAIIEFWLFCSVVALAYNIGHYDSIKYHAMYEQCKDCNEYCGKVKPFPEFNITERIEINRSYIEENGTE